VAGVERQRAPGNPKTWGLTSFDPSHPFPKLATTVTLRVMEPRNAEGTVPFGLITRSVMNTLRKFFVRLLPTERALHDAA